MGKLTAPSYKHVITMPSVSRRALLAGSMGCAGHLLGSLAAAPAAVRRRFATAQKGEVVTREPFGRLEGLAEGVWALVSTPLEARTTLSNGGIIAGSDGVLIVEGFASVEGAQWMAARALELTGQRPTHVALTHYHGDHSGGLAGYRNDSDLPLVFHTPTTRELLRASLPGRETGGAESPLATLSEAALIADASDPVEVDLGGRMVRILARAGHTPSDLAVRLDDPRVVFCGDLVWNGMFPNYMDAIPTRLWTACTELLTDERAIYVPGHGSLADHGETRIFLDVIEHVGEAAQRAFERGLSAAEGAADYQVPESLGEWFMFSPRYYEVAFTAWYRERQGAR
jgi:glyoxylase-like metal-dependent hydrolase (beta-lactamase superfamily II)